MRGTFDAWQEPVPPSQPLPPFDASSPRAVRHLSPLLHDPALKVDVFQNGERNPHEQEFMRRSLKSQRMQVRKVHNRLKDLEQNAWQEISEHAQEEAQRLQKLSEQRANLEKTQLQRKEDAQRRHVNQTLELQEAEIRRLHQDAERRVRELEQLRDDDVQKHNQELQHTFAAGVAHEKARVRIQFEAMQLHDKQLKEYYEARLQQLSNECESTVKRVQSEYERNMEDQRQQLTGEAEKLRKQLEREIEDRIKVEKDLKVEHAEQMSMQHKTLSESCARTLEQQRMAARAEILEVKEERRHALAAMTKDLEARDNTIASLKERLARDSSAQAELVAELEATIVALKTQLERDAAAYSDQLERASAAAAAAAAAADRKAVQAATDSAAREAKVQEELDTLRRESQNREAALTEQTTVLATELTSAHNEAAALGKQLADLTFSSSVDKGNSETEIARLNAEIDDKVKANEEATLRLEALSEEMESERKRANDAEAREANEAEAKTAADTRAVEAEQRLLEVNEQLLLTASKLAERDQRVAELEGTVETLTQRVDNITASSAAELAEREQKGAAELADLRKKLAADIAERDQTIEQLKFSATQGTGILQNEIDKLRSQMKANDAANAAVIAERDLTIQAYEAEKTRASAAKLGQMWKSAARNAVELSKRDLQHEAETLQAQRDAAANAAMAAQKYEMVEALRVQAQKDCAANAALVMERDLEIEKLKASAAKEQSALKEQCSLLEATMKKNKEKADDDAARSSREATQFLQTIAARDATIVARDETIETLEQQAKESGHTLGMRVSELERTLAEMEERAKEEARKQKARLKERDRDLNQLEADSAKVSDQNTTLLCDLAAAVLKAERLEEAFGLHKAISTRDAAANAVELAEREARIEELEGHKRELSDQLRTFLRPEDNPPATPTRLQRMVSSRRGSIRSGLKAMARQL